MVEKLVRDRIPAIIRSKGEEPATRIADPAEYELLLQQKLREEVEEYIASSEPEELADILEVLHALLAQHGLSTEELEQLRAKKFEERGGFADRQVLQR